LGSCAINAAEDAFGKLVVGVKKPKLEPRQRANAVEGTTNAAKSSTTNKS